MYRRLLREVEPCSTPEAGPSSSPVVKAAAFAESNLEVEGVTTLYELFERSAQDFAESPCLGRRAKNKGVVGKYEFWTYAETRVKVQALSSVLMEYGLRPGSKVGIVGPNCPEWMIAIQACNRMSWTCVPIYDSLTDASMRYIIEHSGSECIIAAAENLHMVAKALCTLTEAVKVVVWWGRSSSKDLKALKSLGISSQSLEECLTKQGSAAPPSPPSPEDLCTIMYTSGTTGDPKGVMITHDALLAQVLALNLYLQQYVTFGPGDMLLSYLPLAHIFDRAAEELFLMFGGAIGYWQGSLAYLRDDIEALEPSMFLGVPRVLDKIYSSILSTVNSGGFFKKFVFDMAFARKMKYVKMGIPSTKASPLADRIILRKVSGLFGSKMKLIVSGGSPLSRVTEEFLRVCFQCPVVQGYGLTETCGGSFISIPNDNVNTGTIGIPTAVTEFKLESVPEMNYDALGTQPVGEICIRGRSNFKGYYKNSRLTAEVLGEGGWLRTGDIGRINNDGLLWIVDRKRNIIQLKQGEYVLVEKIEETYSKCPAIDQIWVYGNTYKTALVAIVVPERESLTNWALHTGSTASLVEMCSSQETINHMLSLLHKRASDANLKGIERVRGVHVEYEPFTVENGLLTPTFKLKRISLIEKYQSIVDNLYSRIF